MTKVFAFGTFDGLHAGHRAYLRQAKRQGDHLTVVIGRDARVEQLKGRRPTLSQDQRRDLVERTGLADRVILGGTGEPLDILQAERIDVAVLGFDHQVTEQQVAAAAAHAGQETRVVRARAFMPLLFQNHVLKGLGWMGRLLRRV